MTGATTEAYNWLGLTLETGILQEGKSRNDRLKDLVLVKPRLANSCDSTYSAGLVTRLDLYNSGIKCESTNVLETSIMILGSQDCQVQGTHLPSYRDVARPVARSVHACPVRWRLLPRE